MDFVEIRDQLHGSIPIDRDELHVIDSRPFQRLRQIRQLGFAEHAFPGATHNRYVHSVGVLHLASRALQSAYGEGLPPRFRKIVRLAGLLHDVGHGPLSHTSERAMPSVEKLGIDPKTPGAKMVPQEPARLATHEDYTLKFILDSPLTPVLEKIGDLWGFKPIHLAAVIDPERFELSPELLEFFIEKHDKHGKISFHPLICQITSSELDADRMDYLRRDSLHAGVSYGQFDADWLLNNLTFHVKANKAYLALEHRAVYAFEDFLISRFHMFLMVYFHYKSVVYDEILQRYLSASDCTYSIPADIEKYCEHTDPELYRNLEKSANPWARRIADRKPLRRLMEIHSGMPATRSSQTQQETLLESLESALAGDKIEFLKIRTTGELSKYFKKPGHPIFVRYDNYYSAPKFIPLESCTDLFERYQAKRSITRLYVEPESYSRSRALLGGGNSLPAMPDGE